MGGSGRCFDFALTPLPSPPVPISAVYVDGASTLTVTFDKAIEPFTGAPLGMIMKALNTDWSFIGGVAGNTQLECEMDPQGPGDPGSTLTYLGTDPRLKGLDGQLVEAFADFPLTVV